MLPRIWSITFARSFVQFQYLLLKHRHGGIFSFDYEMESILLTTLPPSGYLRCLTLIPALWVKGFRTPPDLHPPHS